MVQCSQSHKRLHTLNDTYMYIFDIEMDKECVAYWKFMHFLCCIGKYTCRYVMFDVDGEKCRE